MTKTTFICLLFTTLGVAEASTRNAQKQWAASVLQKTKSIRSRAQKIAETMLRRVRAGEHARSVLASTSLRRLHRKMGQLTALLQAQFEVPLNKTERAVLWKAQGEHGKAFEYLLDAFRAVEKTRTDGAEVIKPGATLFQQLIKESNQVQFLVNRAEKDQTTYAVDAQGIHLVVRPGATATQVESAWQQTRALEDSIRWGFGAGDGPGYRANEEKTAARVLAENQREPRSKGKLLQSLRDSREGRGGNLLYAAQYLLRNLEEIKTVLRHTLHTNTAWQRKERFVKRYGLPSAEDVIRAKILSLENLGGVQSYCGAGKQWRQGIVEVRAELERQLAQREAN